MADDLATVIAHRAGGALLNERTITTSQVYDAELVTVVPLAVWRREDGLMKILARVEGGVNPTVRHYHVVMWNCQSQVSYSNYRYGTAAEAVKTYNELLAAIPKHR